MASEDNEDKKVRRILHFRFSLPDVSPEMLAMMKSAAPYLEMFGNAKVRLLRNVDDPKRFIQEIDYETPEAIPEDVAPDTDRVRKVFAAARAAGRTLLTEAEAKEVLAAYDIPVVPTVPVRTEEEAVRLANCTPFGLSSSLWTRDLNRAHRVAEQLETGTVWVNCWLLRDLRTPFGGVKSSGVGREGGDEALRFFTEPKTVCIKT